MVDFIVVGASRSGTTSLYHCLTKIPGLFLPETKELRFFERDGEYRKGVECYLENFSDALPGQVKGEISPPYFHKGILTGRNGGYRYSEYDAAQRIRGHFPNVKIVVSLRNPVDRLYSQYFKNYANGIEKEGLDTALSEELNGNRSPKNTPLCWIYKIVIRSMLDTGSIFLVRTK